MGGAGPARAGGMPASRGVIRRSAADFRVAEQLSFAPSGEGPHTLLRVVKTGRTTAEVAGLLAGHAGARIRDVGYSGLKDKHAVAEQWFTVPWNAAVDWQGLAAEGVQVISAGRHHRKLKRGTHVANRFAIRVVLEACCRADLERRLQRLRSHGVPNYFGEQRFGRRFDADARRLAAGRRLPRLQRSLTLSAMRAALFNRVLDQRVCAASWDTALEGDYLMLEGTRSGFAAAAADPGIAGRIQALDVHPSGPLYGRGASPATGAAAALELAVLAHCEAWCAVLREAGLTMERRATRCVARDLRWRLDEAGAHLDLELSLGRGQFATAVLRELVDYRDMTRPA